MNDRFYIDGSLESGSLLLSGSEFHHLAHVMRVRVGEEIELINGRGSLAQAIVEKMEKESALLSLSHIETHPRPKPLFLIALPILKMDRLEWAVEKATELGADAFRLFPAEWSEKKHLTEHQFERIMHIVISAMKQCGRLYLPSIEWFPTMSEAIQTDFPVFFGDLDPSAVSLAPQKGNSLFISGPEKGFSPKEIEILRKRAHGVRLSENVLRAETAPLVALSLLSQTRISK